MQSTNRTSLAATVGRGVLAGLAGTVVMTAFQELIEMPLTGRDDSYAPANTAEKTFGVHPETQQGRKRLNWVTHFALGDGVGCYLRRRGARWPAWTAGPRNDLRHRLHRRLRRQHRTRSLRALDVVDSGLGNRSHRQVRPSRGHRRDL